MWLHGIIFGVIVTVTAVWFGMLPALGAGIAGVNIAPEIPAMTIFRHIVFGAVLCKPPLGEPLIITGDFCLIEPEHNLVSCLLQVDDFTLGTDMFIQPAGKPGLYKVSQWGTDQLHHHRLLQKIPGPPHVYWPYR